MKQTWIVVICTACAILICHQHSLAQHTSSVDSLRLLLEATKGETERIPLHLDIAALLIESDSAVAYQEANTALAIALQHNDILGIARSYKILGLWHSEHDMLKESEAYYSYALKSYQDLDSAEQVAALNNALGVIHDIKGDYRRALRHYVKALIYYSAVNDSETIAGIDNNIGIVYEERGEYADALSYYLKSLRINEAIHNNVAVAGAYSNIGIIFGMQDDHAKAIEYHKNALNIRERLAEPLPVAISCSNLGEAYKELEDYDSAMYFFNRQIYISSVQDKDLDQLGYGYRGKGDVFLEMGILDSAMFYFNVALDIRTQLGEKRETAETLLSIGQVYYKKGNPKRPSNSTPRHLLSLTTSARRRPTAKSPKVWLWHTRS